jgi:hypothetical protein
VENNLAADMQISTTGARGLNLSVAAQSGMMEINESSIALSDGRIRKGRRQESKRSCRNNNFKF